MEETPAHVGWKNEVKTVTSLNKKTGQVKQHQIKSKLPIMGKIQKVGSLTVHHSKKYDINTKTLGGLETTITK